MVCVSAFVLASWSVGLSESVASFSYSCSFKVQSSMRTCARTEYAKYVRAGAGELCKRRGKRRQSAPGAPIAVRASWEIRGPRESRESGSHTYMCATYLAHRRVPAFIRAFVCLCGQDSFVSEYGPRTMIVEPVVFSGEPCMA